MKNSLLNKCFISMTTSKSIGQRFRIDCKQFDGKLIILKTGETKKHKLTARYVSNMGASQMCFSCTSGL